MKLLKYEQQILELVGSGQQQCGAVRFMCKYCNRKGRYKKVGSPTFACMYKNCPSNAR